MTDITVVTTFHKDGMDLYGQRFLDSFAQRVDKKVKLLVNDDLIKKFLKIFNSKNIDKKQLRIIFQEFIYTKSSNKNTILKIWADTHKPKKIIFLSFDFWDLYVNPNLSNKIPLV